ncbi:MAG: hypothetical protein Q9227_003045 [Pyrenula ochraceoflavens]
MEIGLKNSTWIRANGHMYLSFAAFFGCTDILQSLLDMGARPDEALEHLEHPVTLATVLPKPAIMEAVAAENIDCVRLLIRHCDVNRVIKEWKDERLKMSNFDIFLAAMEDGYRNQEQALKLFLEAGADVDRICEGNFSSSIPLYSTRYPAIMDLGRWPLSVLDQSFYIRPHLYGILAPFSRRADKEVTRPGICLAARQGKAALEEYLNSRPQTQWWLRQCYLELALAEQFISSDRHMDSQVVCTLIDYGVNVQCPTLNVDASFLMSRLILNARVHGYNEGVAAVLTCLLDYGASFNEVVLAAAVAEEGIGLLPLLVVFHADIKRYGGKALATAARFNNFEAVSWLLQAGVDINAGVYINGREVTVISLATGASQEIEYGHPGESSKIGRTSVEMLRHLISCGAKLRNHPKETKPFSFLKESLSTDAIDYLVPQKARLFLETGIDLRDPSGSNAFLLEACFKECGYHETPRDYQMLAAFELLFRRGASVRPGGPLALLIFNGGRDELVKQVLDAGADINAYSGTQSGNPVRFTPIQAAALRCDPDIVSTLLNKGADINRPAAGRFGRTALQAACTCGASSSKEEACRMSLVKFLLAHGADVNAPASDYAGCTALQVAAMCGDIELATLLLHHRANPNATPSDINGLAALAGAAALGRLDMVQLLLNVGALSHCGGPSGYEGAIWLAQEAGHGAVADLLRCHERSKTSMAFDTYSYQQERQ